MVWLHPLLVLGACFVPQLGHALEASSAKTSDGEVELDLVVVAYNSREKIADTLIYDSIKEHTSDESKAKINLKLKTVGEGLDLWKQDDEGNTRGWMFRLRHTIKEVMEEYKRRDEQDFVVLMVDALDVYVPKTFEADALEGLLHRFLTDFAGHKIVLSGQIYCCNPWPLRKVARRDWDNYWESQGDGAAPPSMFKHINAGIFMGYASAILEMADEMKLWDKTYHNQESYYNLMDTKAAEYLRMIDLETDDDEWQLAAWFFEDQSKPHPLSALDYNQELFAVTGTFRSIQRDNGFEVFSREHADLMFGALPEKGNEFEDVTLCPYAYNAKSGSWINVLTGSTPLVFHFAGNDWLCACEVFRAEGYKSIPPKFRQSCEENYYDSWRGRVEQAILHVAHSADPTEQVFLMDDANESTLKVIGGKLQDEDLERFRLDSKTVHRMLDDDPYNGGENTTVNPLFALIGSLFTFAGSILSAIFFCF